MDEEVFCNMCGNEMDLYNDDYHCDFCKRIFGISRIITCTKCGNSFGAIPDKYLDYLGESYQSATMWRLPFECYCKKCRYEFRKEGKNIDNLASVVGFKIAWGNEEANNLLFNKRWAKEFIDLCLEWAEYFKEKAKNLS